MFTLILREGLFNFQFVAIANQQKTFKALVLCKFSVTMLRLLCFLLPLLLIEIDAKKCGKDFINIPKDYNNEGVPFSYNNPCLIKVNFFYIRLLEVNDLQKIITLSTGLNLSWNDDRLKSTGNVTASLVKLPSSCKNALWFPDTYIFGLHQFKQLKLTEKFDYIYLSNDSQITHTDFFEMDIYCNMNFDDYPFDSQNCTLNLTSFYNDKTKIVFELGRVEYSDRHQINNLEYTASVQRMDSFTDRYSGTGGNELTWSVVGFSIQLVRKPKKILIDYCVPSGLLVMVSWVIFTMQI